MSELKPCPFCGRMPTVEQCLENEYFVHCECGINQDKLYHQQCDAVNAWNNRTFHIADDMEIFGYPIKDLVLFAEACRKKGIDETELKWFCTEMKTAYQMIADEFKKSLGDSLHSIVMPPIGGASNGES